MLYEQAAEILCVVAVTTILKLQCLDLQDVIVGERRFQYEAEVKKNPLNYDSWFDYIRLEEAAGDYDKIREVCRKGALR